MKRMKTTKARAILKSISWRIIATLTTIIILYVATGDVHMAAIGGGIEVVIKLLLYYYHERIWNIINFGRL